MSLDPKILIVEDEILIADYIMELLHEENFNKIEMAHEKEEALHKMNSFLPDIILMDINLNGQNSGIELAKLKNENARIIFLTGQYDHVLMSKALKSNPESYLTKPIRKNDLFAAIQLANYKQQSNFITIKDGYDKVKINLDEILFIKSDNNYIDIQLINKKYSIRKSLEAFHEKLQSENFIRIHKSYIVNRTKILKKTSSTVFINEIEIPCSRSLELDL